jgi:putative tryptophan/tyrosine transport system substrate-binding protein
VRWSRRQLVQGAGAVGLGLVAGCGWWPGQGQQTARVHRLGYVGSLKSLTLLQSALSELGYVEGTNLSIDSRLNTAGPAAREAALAELVPTRPDVLVTTGINTTRAAQRLTDSIPIVQAAGAGDLVIGGIVESLARPGGNVTGVTELAPQLAGKRLELLRDTVAGLTDVGVIWNATNPAIGPEVDELTGATQVLGLRMRALPVQNFDELESAIEAAARDRVGALVIVNDGLTIDREPRIATLVLEKGLPSVSSQQIYTEAGGLMAYGASFSHLTRRAAYYVDRILKGAAPADLPVEQPREFDFVINLKTAHALGLTIPQHVLLQATEVIQ